MTNHDETPLFEVLNDIFSDLSMVQDRMAQGPLNDQEAGLLGCILTLASSMLSDLAKADGEQKLAVFTDPSTGVGYPVYGHREAEVHRLDELLGLQGLEIPSEPIEGFFGGMFPRTEIDELITAPSLHTLTNDITEPSVYESSLNKPIDLNQSISGYKVNQAVRFVQQSIFTGGSSIDMASDWPNDRPETS